MITLNVRPSKYAIRVFHDSLKKQTMDEITKLDPETKFDSEGNPVLFWTTTRVTMSRIGMIPSVECVVDSYDNMQDPEAELQKVLEGPSVWMQAISAEFDKYEAELAKLEKQLDEGTMDRQAVLQSIQDCADRLQRITSQISFDDMTELGKRGNAIRRRFDTRIMQLIESLPDYRK